MFAVAWVLLSGVAWCCASPLTPVSATLDAPSSTHNAAGSDVGNVALIPQEKRLLKYLPTGSAWVPTQQEGSKRGFPRNYLRFGRGDTSFENSDAGLDAEDSMVEKRNRNFLRFGRNRNFLRFGRSDAEEFGHPSAPLVFANPEEEFDDYPVEEKRAGHRNYLRFGRGNRNFLRFGRAENRNFLRFGRSVEHQLNEEKTHDTPLALNSRTQGSHRTKRSPTRYNYVVLPSHGPAAWAQDLQPEVDEDIDEALEGPQVSKRNYNKSFLRFGRDPDFLRFAKRNDEDASSEIVIKDPVYRRYLRAPQRNFLRFG